MGRPKKADLQCSLCDKTFLKKIDLVKHMDCHLYTEKNKKIKTYSTWCDICKKKIEDSEYELHFQKEHQNVNDSNDPFLCENGYVLLSKKRIKREVDQSSSLNSKESGEPTKNTFTNLQNKDFEITLTNIKIEPPEISNQELEAKQIKRNTKSFKKVAKASYIKCHVCGIRCRGQRGLKIHNGIAHRKKHSRFSVVTTKIGCQSLAEKQIPKKGQNKINTQNNVSNEEQSECKINSSQVGSLSMLSNNCTTSLNSSIQPGLMCQMLPVNNTTLKNQLNVLETAISQNAKLVEIIPKFDSNSESYVKWLKKFIYKCKISKYPLPPILCENIIHVLDEISDAVGYPVESLQKKSNHFYFMKMHKILSEIIMGHMRHSLSVVMK